MEPGMSRPPLSRPAPASAPIDHGFTAGLLAGARVRALMRGASSSWPDCGACVTCLGFAVAALHAGHGSPATRKATAPIDLILKDTPGSCCRRWVSENQPETRASLQFLGSRTTRTQHTHKDKYERVVNANGNLEKEFCPLLCSIGEASSLLFCRRI
ncbi:hypothetical protein ACQJBY_045193 [Aegilops geniculata]